jgi:molecular chaperone Hsp33
MVHPTTWVAHAFSLNLDRLRGLWQVNPMAPQPTTTDRSSRFLFNDADIRGSFVRLEESLKEVTQRHRYAEPLQNLLGEFLVAALLLSNTIKFKGRLTLQAKGDGPVKTMMAEATHDGKTRGIIQLNEDADETADFNAMFGNGVLAVTIEPMEGERYQSLVPLQGDTLASCLEHYFLQSEQLGTLIHLTANSDRAAGMLLQQLPSQLVRDAGKREQHWQTVNILGNTLTHEELLVKENQTILHQLFSNEDIQLLADEPISFYCSCSEERMAKALISLGGKELDQLFSEDPILELVCEFCGNTYSFDAPALTVWLMGDESAH